MFPIIIHSLFLQISSVLQSALSKTDTFATGTKTSVPLREMSILQGVYRNVKKDKDQIWVSILQRCLSYKGVRYERVNCKLINCIARQHVVMMMIHHA